MKGKVMTNDDNQSKLSSGDAPNEVSAGDVPVMRRRTADGPMFPVISWKVSTLCETIVHLTEDPDQIRSMLYQGAHKHEEPMYVELRQGPIIMAFCFTNVAKLIAWNFAVQAMPCPVLVGHSKIPFGSQPRDGQNNANSKSPEKNGSVP